MGINVIGDDNDDRPRKINKLTASNIKSLDTSNSLLVPVMLIMGVLVLGGMWFVNEPCPEMNCPNVTVPTCPSIPSCPNITCPSLECPSCNPHFTCNNESVILNTEYINQTIDVISITIFNSTNYNQNKTHYLNASSTYEQTTEINTTEIGIDLGELVIMRVN